jgi:NAD(P) transhydrogenase subunit alpha
MTAGIVREECPGERRVALVPSVVASLAKLGLKTALESGAGLEAGLPDAVFAEKGVEVFRTRRELLEASDVVLQVRSLVPDRTGFVPALDGLRAGQVVIGFLDPLSRPEGAKALAAKGVAAFALELVPRITRAQAMDALSSMATIVGCKAVLVAAEALPRIFPMLMTAAGTVAPAKVFVIGGGVAGLQAIATARRLGAVVEAYDIRPAVKEQVASLGARFVELPLEAADAQDAGGYAKAMDESCCPRWSPRTTW